MAAPLPTNRVDKNWPKGPNFLGIVIGFAVAIVVILALAALLLSGKGKNMFPVKTRSTPSQTSIPSVSPAVTQPAEVSRRA